MLPVNDFTLELELDKTKKAFTEAWKDPFQIRAFLDGVRRSWKNYRNYKETFEKMLWHEKEKAEKSVGFKAFLAPPARIELTTCP